jgi:hypothetical protein
MASLQANRSLLFACANSVCLIKHERHTADGWQFALPQRERLILTAAQICYKIIVYFTAQSRTACSSLVLATPAAADLS